MMDELKYKAWTYKSWMLWSLQTHRWPPPRRPHPLCQLARPPPDCSPQHAAGLLGRGRVLPSSAPLLCASQALCHADLGEVVSHSPSPAPAPESTDCPLCITLWVLLVSMSLHPGRLSDSSLRIVLALMYLVNKSNEREKKMFGLITWQLLAEETINIPTLVFQPKDVSHIMMVSWLGNIL